MTSQAVQLGAELREQRRRAGMTVVQVGEALGCHHSTISRWERGETMPDESDTGAVLAIYGVRGLERNRLVELARLNTVPDWVAPYGGNQLAALMEYERQAERITHISPCLVPGLLQTRAYARSLMIGNNLSPDEAEQRTDVRMGRQRVLAGRQPASLVTVIGEMALRFPPCGDATMIEQLRHLLAMSERLNVEIHVLPLDLVGTLQVSRATSSTLSCDETTPLCTSRAAGRRACLPIGALSTAIGRQRTWFWPIR